jgi:hypothetical protein
LNWLDQLASARFDDPGKYALVGNLVRLAAARFCQPLPSRRYLADDTTHSEQSLAALIRVLLIAGDERSLEEVIRLATSSSERFSVEKTQVPSLVRVVNWCRQQGIAVHPLVIDWLHALEGRLSSATAQEPQPPPDWARPAELACSCQFCKQLSTLLADPTAATGQIPAREDIRSHLISEIHKHRSDVTHKLEKRGSPYSLVFTKTNGSFEQRKQRYLANQGLLKTVSGLLSVVPREKGVP